MLGIPTQGMLSPKMGSWSPQAQAPRGVGRVRGCSGRSELNLNAVPAPAWGRQGDQPKDVRGRARSIQMRSGVRGQSGPLGVSPSDPLAVVAVVAAEEPTRTLGRSRQLSGKSKLTANENTCTVENERTTAGTKAPQVEAPERWGEGRGGRASGRRKAPESPGGGRRRACGCRRLPPPSGGEL